MSKVEAPLHQLQQFLPENTLQPILEYLHRYHIHLTVARERKSILGDYRHRSDGRNHRISVNGNLNKYSFLITLIHEIAHLLTFEQYGNRVMAHGTEWKRIYAELMRQFLQHKVFPPDIEHELIASMKNPGASSCAEDDLLRVLRRYDNTPKNVKTVEQIPIGGLFRTSDGKVFRIDEKLRKRYKCTEIQTKRVFLFSPVYEVSVVNSQ